MKIVITHNDFRAYFPPRLLALQEFLEQRGHELYILELFEESIDYKFADNDKSTFHNHEFLFPTYKGISMGAINRKLTKRLDEIDPDVVVSGAIAFPVGATAVRWAQSRGKRAIVMDNAQKDTFERSRLNRFIKKRIFRYVDAFLCPSDKWDATLEYWGFEKEQIFYGLNASDNKFWDVDPGTDVGDEGFFLSVGRFVPKKNQMDILEAYKIYSCKAGDSAPKLLMIGDGVERSRLTEYVSQNALYGVTLLPFKTPQELRAYYHRASCFIIASNKEETWGMVVNEAMNGGCAIIASDQTGCASTLVEEGIDGYIFETGSVTELAGAMERYEELSLDSKDSMSRRSCEIVADWGLERFSAGAAGAIDNVIGRNRKAVNPLDWIILRLWKGRLRFDENSH